MSEKIRLPSLLRFMPWANGLVGFELSQKLIWWVRPEEILIEDAKFKELFNKNQLPAHYRLLKLLLEEDLEKYAWSSRRPCTWRRIWRRIEEKKGKEEIIYEIDNENIKFKVDGMLIELHETSFKSALTELKKMIRSEKKLSP